MARPYRLQGENCLYHIFSRGDDRKKIYSNPSDYVKFMDYIMKAQERYQFYLFAYCLMVNHFHLLIETRLPNISKIMHYIKSAYTTYYNMRHQRCGHLFQGRFKSIVVDKDNYFLELSRYIHLNPVRGGIVEDVGEYQWSSYRGYVGKKDNYIDHDKVRRYLNMTYSAYRIFVLEGLKDSVDLLKETYAGFLLGSERFIKSKLKDLQVQIESEELLHRKELSVDQERADRILESVLKYFHTSLTEIQQNKTRPMRNKQILIYLLKKYTGLTNKEIGNIIGMRYPAVSMASKTIERLIEKDKAIKKVIDRIVFSF